MTEFNSIAETYYEVTGGSAHRFAHYMSPMWCVYDYDPANDGPEVDIIKGILASHPLYTPGKERELLRFQKFVNRLARHHYDNPYSRLSTKRKLFIAYEVIKLHLFVPKGEFAWTR